MMNWAPASSVVSSVISSIVVVVALASSDESSDEQAEAYPLLHVILRGTRPVDVRRHPVDATSGRYAETPVPSGT